MKFEMALLARFAPISPPVCTFKLSKSVVFKSVVMGVTMLSMSEAKGTFPFTYVLVIVSGGISLAPRQRFLHVV